MFDKVSRKAKRFIAFMLSMIMFFTSVQIPVYADVEYSNYLDGWRVQTSWNTLSNDYKWNAADDEVRQPKVVVTYRMEHAEKDYPAGSLTIRIPGIGNVNRKSLLKADKLAADKENSEWSYTWDQNTDTYVFTNKFDVAKGQSVSGGFELLWTLEARNCVNGYTQTASPQFSVKDAGNIILEPLSFGFASEKDSYRIYLQRYKLSGAQYEDSDKDYVWYEFQSRIDADWKARGLYKSNYFVIVDIPDGIAHEDVKGIVNGKETALVQNESGDWGFWLFQDRKGDLVGSTVTHSSLYHYFQVGFKAGTLDGKDVSVRGFLDCLYEDETEWEQAADMSNAEQNFKVEGYKFMHSGYAYGLEEYNTEYENYHYDGYQYNHDEPANYSDRLNAANLYNGKIVQFTIKGQSNRQYANAKRSVAAPAATPSDASRTLHEDEIPEGFEDWNDIHWKEHGLVGEAAELIGAKFMDLYEGFYETATLSEAEKGGFHIPDLDIFGAVESMFGGIRSFAAEKDDIATASEPARTPVSEKQARKIEENEAYSLVLGSDKLAIYQKNGSVRNLEDEEYDIAYVMVPSASKHYDWQLFGAQSQDTPFEEYTLLGTGNTDTARTVQLPQGVNAVYVRVNGIVGNFSGRINAGVRLHLDWATEQAKDEGERVDHEKLMVNFSYLRSVAAGDDGTEINDCPASGDYGGAYGEQLMERDQELYGETLYRDYSHVWLRSPVTNLSTKAEMSDLRGDSRNGFSGMVTASGSIHADDAGMLEKFSLYVELPSGLMWDEEIAEIKVYGSGIFLDGTQTSEMMENVIISTGEHNGNRTVKADFDFSNSPLEISETTNVSVSLPVTLSYVDFLTFGNRYTVRSYLLPHDDGLDKISGELICADEHDIDGNGNTGEKMAYSYVAKTVLDDAVEWREYAAKYAKSAFSNGYTGETVAKLASSEGDAQSKYSYRLDFGLGSYNAKNIVMFDRLEQGAVVSVNGDDEGETETVASAWQGSFVSVDTSFAERMGLKPTVYYSADPKQELDLAAAGWTDSMDPAKVKAVAVSFDTSGLADGVMHTKEMTYVTVNMQASADRTAVGKEAVNQYMVRYDAYALDSEGMGTYELSSAGTHVKLLDSVGRMTLRKVDADNPIRENEDGTIQYASLPGARFQVYDSAGQPVFEEGGRTFNSMGQLIVANQPYGTYYYEELEAPAGYQKLEGRHEFKMDGMTAQIDIPNKRIPGQLTLMLTDMDDPEHKPVPGTVYEVFRQNGEQIYTNGNGEYAENGTVSEFKTDENGQIIITGLPWGSYVIKEKEPAKGYEENTKEIPFSVGKAQYDKETDSVRADVTASAYEMTASILLNKTDAESRKPVRDAVYSLFREEKTGDKLVTSGQRTNAAGELEVSGLKFGAYHFVETRNPGGYEMPDAEHARTEAVVLDADTAGGTVQVSHSNERRTGSVVLTKTDDAGQLVGGAEYALYHKADTAPDTAGYKLHGTYTTENNKDLDSYGEIHVDGLSWGDYYFLETKAPLGYELSEEQVKFSIDRESVQNTVYVSVIDNRKSGSVRLSKADKDDTSKMLAGAEYELFRTDGTKCVAGTDFSLPGGAKTIVTGADGTVLISDIRQGAYYLKESKAPASYSISDELIRFSVTKENADIVQELTALDERGKATISITKELNDANEAFGSPTFIFKIKGDDGREFTKSLSIDAGSLSATLTLTVPQGTTYTVTEIPVSRYKLSEILPGENASVDGDSARLSLVNGIHADVTFVGAIEQWEMFSHVTNSTNIVKAATKLTGITVDYVGPDPITKDLPGYDTEDERYAIPEKDLIVTAFYDDGTSKEIAAKNYSLSPTYADGSSDTYTGTVSYTESGATRKASFQANLELPKPTPRFMVTFDLGGGTIVPDGGSSAQETLSVQAKQGTSVTKPQNDPKKDGYLFKGWFTDSGCTKAATFKEIVSSNMTYYAKWEQDAVKVKYAVSIYGIQQDVDASGKAVGLTFGPSTGESYVNTFKSHSPSAGQMCMHGMTWEEIIAQSKKEPNVFQECMEIGCTHAVELTIKGPLAQNATSYPDMAGDGAGMLYHSINNIYRKWNNEESNAGGWPASRIRATLNGRDANTDETVAGTDLLDTSTGLISALPDVLQRSIIPKTVKSDTVYLDTDGNNKITYDKLWLFSHKETYENPDDVPSHIRNNEGNLYDRQRALGIEVYDFSKNKCYDETSVNDRLMRTIATYNIKYVSCIALSGGYSTVTANYDASGISFGFCIPGPDPDVKYAVSVYGIKHDMYKAADGTTGTAGLTFGPATGASFKNDYVSRSHNGADHSGNTAAGNAYRCIHDDSWNQIIEWSQKDPYVYQKCMGDADHLSCTKAVPLYLNEKLRNESGVNSYGYATQSGDGAGALRYVIQDDYCKWNRNHSAYFPVEEAFNDTTEWAGGSNKGGWPDSLIRNTLNGTLTANMLNVTNKDNGFAEAKLNEKESFLGTLPKEIQDAIVPKAVKSDIVYNDKTGNNVTTYDKLWLFSGRELYREWVETSTLSFIRPNEGTVYERQKMFGTKGNPFSYIYNEYGANSTSSWTRTLQQYKYLCILSSGNINKPNQAWAVSFGFCIR